LALLASGAYPQATAVDISSLLNIREQVGANSVDAPQGDQIKMGASCVVDSTSTCTTVNAAAGFTGYATQTTSASPPVIISVQMQSQESATSPDGFDGYTAYSPYLQGAWLLTFTDSSNNTGTSTTPTLVDPPVVPAATSISVSSVNLSPTITWQEPPAYLTLATNNQAGGGIGVRIWDLNPGTNQSPEQIYQATLATTATSVTVPATFNTNGTEYTLQPNHPYLAEIQNLIFRTPGAGTGTPNTLARAHSFQPFTVVSSSATLPQASHIYNLREQIAANPLNQNVQGDLVETGAGCVVDSQSNCQTSYQDVIGHSVEVIAYQGAHGIGLGSTYEYAASGNSAELYNAYSVAVPYAEFPGAWTFLISDEISTDNDSVYLTPGLVDSSGAAAPVVPYAYALSLSSVTGGFSTLSWTVPAAFENATTAAGSGAVRYQIWDLNPGASANNPGNAPVTVYVATQPLQASGMTTDGEGDVTYTVYLTNSQFKPTANHPYAFEVQNELFRAPTLTGVTYGFTGAAGFDTSDSNVLARSRAFVTVGGSAQTITPLNLPSTALVQPYGGGVSLNASASSNLPVTVSSLTPLVCAVTNQFSEFWVVTILSEGTCTIAADQVGGVDSQGTYWSSAPEVTANITVTGYAIVFNPIALCVPSGSQGCTQQLNAVSSTGAPVTFAILPETQSVCSVSGITLTVMTSGLCTITASAGATGAYPAAQSVTLSFESQTITFPAFNVPPGDLSGSLSAYASPSNLPITYTVLTPSTCTITGTYVYAVGPYVACEVAANQSGGLDGVDANGYPLYYAPAPEVTQSFETLSTALIDDIYFAAIGPQPLTNSPITVSATDQSSLPIYFTSETAAVCTVTGTSVALLTTGTCTLDASSPGGPALNGGYYLPASQTQSFSVQADNTSVSTQPVIVSPNDSTTGMAVASISVTFPQVTSAGLTTVTQDITLPAAIPASTMSCSPVIAVDIATTATFTGAATVCLPLGTGCPANATIYHYVNGAYSQLASVSAPAGSGEVCGTTTSFSPFTVLAPALAAQTISFPSIASQSFSRTGVALNATASSGLAVTFTTLTSSVCTVSGATVTLVSTGTCTIAANQVGNASYGAAPQVTESFAVTQGSQSITFGTIASQTLASSGVSLVASASSGLPVTFTSLTSSVCSVSGNTVSLLTTGSCSIAANQAGNTNYAAAAQVSQTFSVTQASQTITFATIGNQILGQGPVAAAVSSTSGLTVTLTSQSPTICTVSGAAITLVATGQCTIDANQAGNATYAAAPQVMQTFTISPALMAQTITFPAIGSHALGSGSFSVTVSASSGLVVALTSQTTSICSISGTSVSLLATGTCTLQATQPGNASFAAASPVSQSFQITSTSGGQGGNASVVPIPLWALGALGAGLLGIGSRRVRKAA